MADLVWGSSSTTKMVWNIGTWGGTTWGPVSTTGSVVWNDATWGGRLLSAYRVVKVEVIRATDQAAAYILHLRGES